MLEEADIVLTTFARLSIREELRELRFESLLIDEASTAPLPYVAFAASRVAGPAIAVGDFQQLPPVVSSTAPAAMRWLRTDLFREAGVVDRAGAGDPAEAAGGPGAAGGSGAWGGAGAGHALPSPNDGLCAMLDLQYRMVPDIRELVSEFFYGGRLRDAPEVAERGAGQATGRRGGERCGAGRPHRARHERTRSARRTRGRVASEPRPRRSRGGLPRRRGPRRESGTSRWSPPTAPRPAT